MMVKFELSFGGIVWRAISALVLVAIAIAGAGYAIAADETALFEVRGETATDLLASLRQIKEKRPAGESRETEIAFFSAACAIVTAADRILAIATDDTSTTLAREEKLDALWQLVILRRRRFAHELAAAAKPAKDDRHSTVARARHSPSPGIARIN